MRRRTRAYIEGFASIESVLELEQVTAREVLASLGGERDMDLAISPWRRGCREALRKALATHRVGHS
jgi:CHAD domain-containing protein